MKSDLTGRISARYDSPEDVYAPVKATFEGGANGIILSRKYSEMRLDNLRAAGRAVRETVKRG